MNDAAKAQAEFQKTQELAIAAEQREAALLAEHADKATKLSAAVKILNQDYLAMIKGWIAGAQVNPLQGFIQGFNAITSIFTGGDNALKNYVTRFDQINIEFNKVKKTTDDS